jgi:hypothetical protein
VPAALISNHVSVNNLQILPNPISDRFTVSQKNIQQLTLIDMQGKRCNLTSLACTYDMAHLPAGLYISKVIDTNGKVFTSKLNKQ